MKATKEKEADLGNGSIGKLLFRLALPAILAQIINVMYNMVDRMYIGHIPEVGPSALTGVGVTMPVIMAISAFAALVSMGGAPRASIMMGKGDNETAEKILGNCTTMLVLMAIVLTAVILMFGQPILLLFGASENTIGYAWAYMQIYGIGTLFVQISLGLNAFINAQGYAKTGMLTVAIGAVCNIILDPIFIFGLNMGVRGAALATILSQAVSFVWVLRFLSSDKSSLRIRRKNLKLSAAIILPSIGLGVSPFIMQFTESIISVCFNTSLLKYGGDIAVGAMTIMTSVMQFSMLPLQGMTQGAQPIISFNYGAGSIDRVKKAFRLLLVACLAYSTLLWAIAMFLPQIFIAIFTGNAELAVYTEWAIRIYMAASLLFGIQIACQQTFIALGNALTSVFLARFCPEKLYKILKPAVSLLAGIPSIVYGFFGLVVMVPIMQNLTGVSGKNVLTAGILLGFMILPTIIEVSEAQIRAVPNSYYEGSLALGATHERSVYFAMLPAAKSGIMAGVILGIGRAIGETMVVVMIAGNQAVLPKSLVSGVRTMTANIVLEMGYATDLHREALIATGVVLFVFILIINVCFSLVKKGRN